MKIHVWRAVQWWDDWQLRILVLGSLGLQWFLLVAAPMRKYSIPRIIRTFIWLAYISSDALAIYALATLFNRHARATHTITCAGDIVDAGSKHNSSILEVLWAPILLIHMGGQEEMTAYEIEDNELWTRHTVTLVSQVAVALYAFYKSWPPSSDWRLLSAAVLLFVIGVASFSEKPLALNRAKIKRLASISALIQGTKKSSKWRDRLHHFFLFEESSCFDGWLQLSSSTGGGGAKEEGTRASGLREGLEESSRFDGGLQLSSSTGGGGGKEEGTRASRLREGLSSCWNWKLEETGGKYMTEGDKVLMVLSDMSLLAAAKDLVARKKAPSVDAVLPPLPVAEKALPRWLRSAFAFIYTRATVVVTPLYLVYHLLVVPVLHIAAITLFAMSDKHQYKRPDVKITYIVMCLTAALDVFVVFIRQLLYRSMSMTQVPALCEMIPGYNVIEAAELEINKGIGFMYTCARLVGFNCKEYFACKPHLGELYKKVSGIVLADLVYTRGQDLGSYRIFSRAAHKEMMPGTSSVVAEDKTDDGQEHKQEGRSADSGNWILGAELQTLCGAVIKESLGGVSFDRSVLLWHIATDLCCIEEEEDDAQEEEEDDAQEKEDGADVKEGKKEEDEDAMEQEEAPPSPQQQGTGATPGVPQSRRKLLRFRRECTVAISNYMAHLLNFNPEMLLTGSREHLISEAMGEIKSYLLAEKGEFSQKDKLRKLISDIADGRKVKKAGLGSKPDGADTPQVFHIIEACKLARELLGIQPESKRWMLIYHVWLGMLCYSSSMCRGYLHAKSLGEGGEFLSFIWLVLSLKGAMTLADKLQMPPETQAGKLAGGGAAATETATQSVA